MQIGNNRPTGPQPNDRERTHLDPDLTKANRDGIEKTRQTGEDVRTGAKDKVEQSKSAAETVRKDSFERSKPASGDSKPSVEERIEAARNKAGREGRIRHARQEHTKAQANKPETGDKEQRIENARKKNTELQVQRKHENRIASARQEHTKRTAGTDNGEDKADRAQRISNARIKNTTMREAKAQRESRIESARQEHTKRTQGGGGEVNRTRAQHGSLSRESLEISAESRRLSAEHVGGSRVEHTEAHKLQLDKLRAAHEKGELNTPERIDRAAGRILGGE